MILAVDLGVKTGMALFEPSGELVWVRSSNFGNASRLRKAVPGFLNPLPERSMLVMEGGGAMSEIWEKEALKHNISVIRIHAGEWRKDIFYQREQRSGVKAKSNALQLAMDLIRSSGVAAPKSLTDDAAEAFLVGYWFINYYLK